MQNPPIYGPGLPYRPSVGGQIGEGITSFLQNYWNAKKAKEDEAKRKFYEGIQMAQQGIPVDPMELGKLGQKAGIPLQWDAPSPEEQQYQQQMQQAQQAQQGAGQLLAGQSMRGPMQGPGPVENQSPMNQLPMSQPNMQMLQPVSPASLGAQQLLQASPMPSGPPPQHPQPGLLQRMGLMQPPVSMQSPGVQAMQRLNQIGQMTGPLSSAGAAMQQRAAEAKVKNLELDNDLAQIKLNIEKITGIPMAKMDLAQRSALFDLFGKGLAGDPDATQMLVRSKVFEGAPVDAYYQIIRLGNPDMPGSEVAKRAAAMLYRVQNKSYEEHILNLSKDFAPRFGNDLAKAYQYVSGVVSGQPTPGLQPSFTADEMEKTLGSMTKIMDQFPTAPSQLAYGASISLLVGNTTAYDGFMKALGQYPTKGSVEQANFNRKQGFDENTILARLRLQEGELNVSKYNAVMRAGGDQLHSLVGQLQTAEKAGDEKELASIRTQIANLTGRMSEVKMRLPDGREISVQDPLKVIYEYPGKLRDAWRAITPWSDPMGVPTASRLGLGGMAGVEPPNVSALKNNASAMLAKGAQTVQGLSALTKAERDYVIDSIKDHLSPQAFLKFKQWIEEQVSSGQLGFPQ